MIYSRRIQKEWVVTGKSDAYYKYLGSICDFTTAVFYRTIKRRNSPNSYR